MTTIEELEKRIVKIELRNQSVEADKAWETSYVRKFLIMFLTYLVIGAYLIIIKVDKPWINAIVPVLGFALSTLTVSAVKKIWVKYFIKKLKA